MEIKENKETKNNKQLIYDKIKWIPNYGILPNEKISRFKDDDKSSLENLFKYRLSKICIYIDSNNNIIGIHSFFKNTNNEEIPGEPGYDKNNKDLNFEKLEIAPNDYVCYLNIFVGSDYITKLVFKTKKGKVLSVGEGGEEKIISAINKTQDNIILNLSGGYYKNKLCLLSCKYINIQEYYANSIGYFELKRKFKNQEFKNNILSNLDNYNEKDRVLIRVCLLPDSCFDVVILYCMTP